MDTECTTTFDSLPYEVAIQIFDNLSQAQRKKCRLVSKRWNSILDEWARNLVFHSLLTNRTQQTFLNSTVRMNSAIMRSKTNKMPKNPTFPYIRHAVIGWKNSAGNITNFLKYGIKNSQSLTITKHSMEKMNTTQGIGFLKLLRLRGKTWKNLAQFKICTRLTEYKSERSENHLDAVVILLKSAKIPKLKELDFEFLHGCETLDPNHDRELRFQSLCLALYKFLNSHAQTLKIFNCTILTGRDASQWFKFPEIPDSLGTRQTGSGLASAKIRLWGLDRIDSMISPAIFGSQLQNLELNTERPQDGIGSLTIHKFRQAFDLGRINFRNMNIGVAATDSNNLDKNFLQIFANNSNSLKNVQIHNLKNIPLECFNHCCALESIYIKNTYGGIAPPRPPETIQIPQNIFDSSSKTLRHIQLEYFQTVDFSWFSNCLNLETLDINTNFGIGRELEEQRKQKLIPMKKLIKFHLRLTEMENQNAIGEIQQLFTRCGKNLEDLKISASPDGWQTIYLGECVALKKLKTFGFETPDYFMRGTVPNNFANLIAFFTEFHANPNHLADWLIETMPNLEILGYLEYEEFDQGETYISLIKKLLIQLPKLKKLALYETLWSPAEGYEEINAFCNENPGTKIVIEDGDEGAYYKMAWMVIDRSVYVTQA